MFDSILHASVLGLRQSLPSRYNIRDPGSNSSTHCHLRKRCYGLECFAAPVAHTGDDNTTFLRAVEHVCPCDSTARLRCQDAGGGTEHGRGHFGCLPKQKDVSCQRATTVPAICRALAQRKGCYRRSLKAASYPKCLENWDEARARNPDHRCFLFRTLLLPWYVVLYATNCHSDNGESSVMPGYQSGCCGIPTFLPHVMAWAANIISVVS